VNSRQHTAVDKLIAEAGIQSMTEHGAEVLKKAVIRRNGERGMKPVTKKYGAAENLLPRTLLFFFNDSFCRADVLTGAAFRTFFLTDNILISSLFNSIRRTFFCTGSTGNTVISYLESHEPITSLPFNSNIKINQSELQDLFFFYLRQFITYFYIVVS
jgi:hypothetical protein